MSREKITPVVRSEVERRANYRCEYCLTTMQISTQAFEVDHIIPLSQGGTTSMENLAIACRGCNAHKHSRIEGFDNITQSSVRLFHPRKDSWLEHFAWDNDPTQLIVLTPIGRASIEALKMNRPQLVSVRRLLQRLFLHPPK